MEYKQIQELIKTINKSNISELSIEQGDFKITIKQESAVQTQYIAPPMPAMQYAPAATPAPQQAAPEVAAPAKSAAAPAVNDKHTEIKSPMIGTFYRSPSPDKEVFVKVGDTVKKGDVLCIIEAMKLFNEIECEIDCRIIKVMADDSAPVEYDEPLFLVEPI